MDSIRILAGTPFFQLHGIVDLRLNFFIMQSFNLILQRQKNYDRINESSQFIELW